MPKRKSKGKKFKLNYIEVLIKDLKKLSTAKGVSKEQKQTIDSLLRWYLANHFLTSGQIKLAKSLTVPKQVKTKSSGKHYVYAISDGENIKIGMSNNVESRLKTFQTSNSKDLLVVWKYYTGRDSKDARKVEKMLHRHCKDYLIRGEWFRMDALEVIKSFNPNRKYCAKWEFAKLVSVDKKRKNGVLNYSISDIRRNNITKDMARVWEQRNTDELYQKEIASLLEDKHIVLLTHN